MQALSRILWPFFMVVLSGFSVGNALAKEVKMLGVWCSDDGMETLYLESNSIGFNEHTVCEMASPLPEASHVQVELSCANIYFHGDEIVRAFEQTKMFEAFYTSPNRLKIVFGDDADPVLFTRCDE